MITELNHFYFIRRISKYRLNDEIAEEAKLFVTSLFPLMNLLRGRDHAQKLAKTIVDVSDMYMRDPKLKSLKEMHKICRAKLKHGSSGIEDVKPCIDIVTRSSREYKSKYSAYGKFDKKPQILPVPHASTDQYPDYAVSISYTGQRADAQPHIPGYPPHYIGAPGYPPHNIGATSKPVFGKPTDTVPLRYSSHESF